MANIIVTSMVEALINLSDINLIENALNSRKEELNLNGEIKRTKVTDNYLEKYIDMINLFFEFIKCRKIKVIIMFAQNAFVSDGLTKKQTDNEYSMFRYNYELQQSNIEITEIVEIDSKKHIIQQCMDIILGSMNFKLNDFDKIKDEATGKRSKRTVAKEKLYKVINKNIRDIRKGFNVGVSTSNDGDVTNIWKHQYRHWNFISKYSHFDRTLTKKEKTNKSKAPLILDRK